MYVLSSVSLGAIYICVMIALLMIFPHQVLKIFESSHDMAPELVEISIRSLRYICAYLGFSMMTLVYSGAIKGAGDTRFSMFMGVGMSWGLLVIPTYLARRFDASIWTMWTLLVIYVIITGLAYLLRYRLGAWQQMRVIESD